MVGVTDRQAWDCETNRDMVGVTDRQAWDCETNRDRDMVGVTNRQAWDCETNRDRDMAGETDRQAETQNETGNGRQTERQKDLPPPLPLNKVY